MIVGLVFAIPGFIISMSRDFGLLAALFGPAFAPMGTMSAMDGMAHATPATYQAVNWLLFALSLPVMLYTGYPYFVHGYKALRNGAANMDVLVALGSSVAFVYSVLVLLGVFQGHVYLRDGRRDPGADQRGQVSRSAGKGPHIGSDQAPDQPRAEDRARHP